jgi:hypothetical protein
MLIFFIALLAALGAAFVYRGHEVRGLLVLLVANATVAAGAAASTRWGWLAFSTAMTGICLLGIAAVLGGTILLAGCGDKYTEPFKDAPRTHNDNGAPADLIRMPDGFSNVATKCDYGNRIYIAYHGGNAYASVAVVPQDPSCQ